MHEGRKVSLNIAFIKDVEDYFIVKGWYLVDFKRDFLTTEASAHILNRIGKRSIQGGDWEYEGNTLFFRRRIDAIWYKLMENDIWATYPTFYMG